MKQFQFRLQKVLGHKEHLYDVAKENYHVALKKLEEERQKFDAIKMQYQKCLNELTEHKKNKFNVKELAVYYKYIFYKKYEMKQQIDEINKADIEAQSKREQLVKSSKEKQILEKLKDKKFQKYQFLLAAEEQKTIDEAARSRFLRST